MVYRAGFRCRDFHCGFVGFQRDQWIFGFNVIAWRHQDFDHFDAMTVCVPDGPRPNEILMAIAIADGRTANITIHFGVSSLVNALRETFAGLPSWSERQSLDTKVSGSIVALSGSTLKLH